MAAFKKLARHSATVTAFFVGTSAFAADNATWYGTAHLGKNSLELWHASVDFGGPVLPGRLDLNKSLHGGFALGRDFGKWRAELEFKQSRIDIDSAVVGTLTQESSGRGRYRVGMFNGYREVQVSQSLLGYIGGGIGYAKVRLPEITVGAASACRCFRGADKGDWTYQGRVGV